MRIAAVIFQYACLAFALFLCSRIATSLYQQDYQLMEIVSDVGSILICIDLAIFLHFNKSMASIKLRGSAQQSPVQISRLEKVSRKLGHLGIMLIICSWIVPKLV
ncbi:hypothetical protein AY606_10605 [Acinetobacter sp. SFB]|uniref:hypothetical protein n=1 Tax=Acinetobacter sp. SFB TaxID=1805634 RepID=UPI0007D858EF|nr:hypothetical protein [Acinetobacter sp. SFB]OAL77886.1 hypothetical protein AY606_10605 [Acinetobacter sp. SFB]